ncbi:hypothetical protein PSTT_04243, partial [Puccinia striiformis]
MLAKHLGPGGLLAIGVLLSSNHLNGVTSADIRRPCSKFIVKIDPTKTNSLDDFCKHLNSINITHSVAHDLTGISPEHFYGASLKLDHPGDVKKLRGLDAVVSVTPVTPVKLIAPVSQQILTKPPTEGESPHGFTPQVQTRVTDLHSKGIYGSGVKVAFLDSGIDCGHPALGGGFGPGHKIGFGYDLVGDDFDGSNAPVPDSDPCTPCGVHGTHVAGIVGANDVGYGFQGVAPNATLGMYLMGCASDGSSDNVIVISALLMAVRDGADVISASIGGFGGWSKGDALSDLINDLVGKGFALILAAGNEGSEGLFYAESPAAATNSLAVGSVKSKKRIVFHLQTSSGRTIPYGSSGVFNGTNLPVYVTSPTSASSSDACQPLPPSTPSLAGHVVLIRRGGCTFAEKVDTVVAHGATRILFYMNSTDPASLSNFMSGAQVATLAKEDGESLVSELRKNPNLKATFSASHSFESTDGGGLVSYFSQYGPSYDSVNIQPNFLGVGGDILNGSKAIGKLCHDEWNFHVYPPGCRYRGSDKRLPRKRHQGTEAQNHPSTTAQQVPAAVGSSDIESQSKSPGFSPLFTPVVAWWMRFAHVAKTVLSIDALRCVIFPTSKPSTFTITNEGDISYSFRTGHSPAITVNTFQRGSHRVSTTVETVHGSPAAQAQVSPATFTLGPKASQDIHVTFTLPTGLSPELLPVYSGYISVLSDAECERHTLPYYGIAGVMKNTRVIDLGPDTEDKKQQVPRLTDFNRKPLNGSVDFNGNGGVVTRYRLAFGSPYMRVDVINANATLANEGPSPAQISGMPDLGANFTLSKRTFLGTNLIGMVPTSNSTYVPRTVSTDTVVLSWDGTLVPIGSIGPIFQVPGGHYKILIRALRVNGNPYTDADFDYWVSPPISVLGSPVVQRPTTPQPPSPPASARAQAPPTSQPHVGLQDRPNQNICMGWQAASITDWGIAPLLNVIESLDDFSRHLHSIDITHSVAYDLTKISPENFYGASLILANPGDAEKLSSLDTVEPPAEGQSPDEFTPQVQTRVTDLHSRGIYGSGVKVAFLDSGIDCGHPALGGGFGPGHKIAFGYDLVGDDFDGHNSPVPDSDPSKFHGTHVAGIVGANDVGYGFQGVAPNATLGMYRELQDSGSPRKLVLTLLTWRISITPPGIFGCEIDRPTSDDIVISALLMAIRDGADVVSVSIGDFGGWSKGDVLSDVINDLVGKGLTLLWAAGNEGSEGLFYAERPAAATHSMAIGSVEPKKRFVFNLQTSSGKIFPYHSNGVLNGTDLPLYVTSPTSGTSSDACRPLPASTPSLAEHIVVIQRGDCTDAEKVDTAVVKGATRILLYMNSTELVYLTNFMSGAQVATLTKEDGELLVSELRKNPNLKATFSSRHSSGRRFESAACRESRLIFEHQSLWTAGDWSASSHNSKWLLERPAMNLTKRYHTKSGPSYDSVNIQPNFLGVGRDILSTFPRNLGSYAMMSGTSMSTPQVAGIAALIKGFRGKDIKALKLKAILSTTAQQVPAAVGSSEIETTIHAGGGLVDAFCACFAKTVLSIDALALRDIPNFKAQHTFTITNEGDISHSFRTGHSPAITVIHIPAGIPQGLYESGDCPRFPSRSGARLSPERLPVYSGYISVLSDAECERHTLPYYGIAGVMKNARIIDIGTDTEDKQQQVPRLTDSNRQPPKGPISFDGNSGVALRYRLAFGSPYMRVDVIDANATLAKEGPSPPPMQAMPDIGANFTLSKRTFLGANLVGMLPTSNSTYAPRTASAHTVEISWNGTVIPIGSVKPSFRIPSGHYKILIRALRVNGNPNTDADFDYWVSPAISVSGSPVIHRPTTPQSRSLPASMRG